MLKVVEEYKGEYKGISWQINLNGVDDKMAKIIKDKHMDLNATWWTAYIRPSPKYDYSDYYPFWDKYIGVHWGFSYGSKTELGWDYNHLDDKTDLISKEKVIKDIENAIEQYLKGKRIIAVAYFFDTKIKKLFRKNKDKKIEEILERLVNKITKKKGVYFEKGVHGYHWRLAIHIRFLKKHYCIKFEKRS